MRRITLTRPNLESIAAELEVADVRGYPRYQPHYNVAPSQQHPVLVLQEFEGKPNGWLRRIKGDRTWRSDGIRR